MAALRERNPVLAVATPAGVGLGQGVFENKHSQTIQKQRPETMNMTATYSPENNKLRLYSVTRLSPELYARMKAAGFKFAPRQELFVAPMWTPGREDLLIELCGEIDDEDTSLVERAEERSERFSEYSEHRTADADRAQKAVSVIADNIPFGQPILIGHHSERRARRDAEKIENGMRRAIKMWDTASYWTDRAAGAIRNAKHKERPDVRARRIKGLEADKRKRERTTKEAEMWLKLWTDCANEQDQELQKKVARKLAGVCHMTLPRKEGDRQDFTGSATAYDVLREEPSTLFAPRTLEEVFAAAQTSYPRGIAYQARWIAHYENRLAYERAMLAEDGGTLADQNKPEKGGACRCWASPRNGWSYIQKVNRVTVSVLHNYSEGGQPFSITVPFDKLTGIMSAAAVEQKRNAGLVIESSRGTGFYLTPTPTPTNDQPEEPAEATQIEEPNPEHEATAHQEAEPVTAPPCAACHRPWSAHATHPATTCGYYWSADEWAKEQARVAPSHTGEQIEAMRQTLRSGGVAVVSAPQLFPTPATLAARMVELAEIEPGQEVLEPSAGTGVLCQAIKATQPTARVFAVEINHRLCKLLTQTVTPPEDAAQGICRNVLQGDFLECFGLGRFDRIVMNPPFADGDDIKHITHALRLLNPGGRIVALCANGPRQNAKLRPIIEEMGGEWEELPANTFAAAGTNVRTVLLTATQPR